MNSQVPIHSKVSQQTINSGSDPNGDRRFGFFIGLLSGFVCSTVVFGGTALALFSVTGLARSLADETATASGGQRPIGEMRRDVEAFLKNSKSEHDLDLQVGGIIDLCYMHQEIVADPRFASNRQLQSIRAVAASRLKKYRKLIDLKKSRRARQLKKQQAETNRKLLAGEEVPNRRPVDSSDIVDVQIAKASQLPGSNSENSMDQTESSDDAVINDSMYGTANSLGRLIGGPSQMFGYLSGNFAPPWDHGEELVNLIESTINPEFWERNGGDGIIQYYRPSRIIIVGATSQIQDDLTNMLRNLRRLSR